MSIGSFLAGIYLGSNVKLLKAKEIIKGYLNSDNALDMLKAQYKAKEFLKEVSE